MENGKKTTKRLKPIWVLAVLVLFLWTCNGCSMISTRYGTYKNAGKYSAGNFEYKTSDISAVEINWVSGNIHVVQTDDKELSVAEDGKGLKESQRMHWLLDGNKLIIQYCRSGYNGRISGSSKNLTVEIPAGTDISVNSVSGNLDMEGNGSYGEVDIDMVSGDVKMGLTACDKIRIDAVSGNVNLLTLPEKGASVEFSHVSGKLKTDRDYEKKGDQYVFGEGKCLVKINTVSGDVRIQ